MLRTLLLLCTLSLPAFAHTWKIEGLHQDHPRVGYGLQMLRQALSTTTTERPLRLWIGKVGETTTEALEVENKPEAFAVRLRGDHVTVVGRDDNGMLYGLLALADEVQRRKGWPETWDKQDAPALKLRGPCIGMQKTYILPGHKVYEYPYTSELFPFFYDKAHWVEYFDMMARNRFNSLYLWNGHPFSSLVRLPEYAYALEVSEAQLAENQAMFRWIAEEANRRGIWVVQMFYNIILPKPFAERHGLSTQLAAPHPIAADYTRKSIAEFVREYPNVGLMVCLGEALQGLENQTQWCNEVILAGVRDGMRLANLTEEPPVVIRTHATDARVIMPQALKVYKNLYTEAKYNGESLTTWEPRGVRQALHVEMSQLGSTHLSNVHLLSNLEPFRYGAQQFIKKSVQASRDRLGAGGLHLYPLAYWNWPDTPDKVTPALKQIDRDWLWFEAWARYAWNPDIDPSEDRSYWLERLTTYYGNPAAAAPILDAYNDSGECAPRILRRFGITEGNRQTMALGMTLDELVNPKKYREFPELWESQSPLGERIREFVEKQQKGRLHEGETPLTIIEEVLHYSDKAVRSAEAAQPLVTRNQEEFARLLNDIRCIRAMSQDYAAKVRAALAVVRFEYTTDVRDLEEAERYLTESLGHFRELARLTEDTYHFANTMQTTMRRIPVTGALDGKPVNYHWRHLVPIYAAELEELRAKIAAVKSGAYKPRVSIGELKKVPFRLISGDAEAFEVQPGARLFLDQSWTIQSTAPELQGLRSIRVSDTPAREGRATPVVFEVDQPVEVLIGYIQSKEKGWRQPPDLETDALAAEQMQAEPLLLNAATVDTLPPINVYVLRFPAGRHTLAPRGEGSFCVLGVIEPRKK